MKKDITELYVFVADFCNALDLFEKERSLADNCEQKSPTRIPQLTMAEMLTILILYHQSPCRNFKFFYSSYLQLYRKDFPHLVSYERFVSLQPRTAGYLVKLLQYMMSLSAQDHINFIDSTSINVCNSKRISRNKVFKGLAQISKTTKGWFYGFKLHIVINSGGEIQNASLTRGNVDDRTPVPDLVKRLTGLLFGDKGYIKSELFNSLYDKGLKLVTGIKKGMKNLPMLPFEKKMLRKRSLVETVFDYLKNKLELEHTRHRSPMNFFVHVLTTLITYCAKTSKPKIKNNFAIANF